MPTLEQLLDHFEQAWRSGPSPDIAAFLPPDSELPRCQCLEELVKIDLEYRWRHRGNVDSKETSAPANSTLPGWPLLEDYVRLFPEMGPVHELTLELIGEEYRVRQRWGDRPAHAEYAARFPQHGPALTAMMLRIDAMLAKEFAPANRTVVRNAPVNSVRGELSPPVRSSSAFLEALRHNQLLATSQWDELGPDLERRFPEPKLLARELLQRGWLTPHQATQLLQGQNLLLGQYLVLERLGEGGTSEVFKARHLRLQRIVALKLMRPELLADAEVVRRFYREIEVVSRLDHPHVIHAYDAGPLGSMHFLAMEYVEGVDLGRLVKQSGPLPLDQACDYVRQAALGLQHAHEHGLVHRDVKPSNLLVACGNLKVLDLGLARLQRTVNGDRTNTFTPQGAVMIGTPDYLAPEQAMDFHGADIRADIYGLGCTFYYLLTGQPPFLGGTLVEKLMRHQQLDPPAAEALRPDLPEELASVLSKMMAKLPEDRYQTPGEVADILATWLRDRRLPSIAHQPKRLPGAVRKKRLTMYGVGAAGVLLLGLIVSLVVTPRPTPEQPPADRWLLGDGRVLAGSDQPGRHPGGHSLAFSPDGSMLASGGDDTTVRLWDAVTLRERAVLKGHSKRVTAVVYAPRSKGRVLASASEDGTVRLWDTAKQQGISLGTHQAPLRCLAFSPNGQRLVSGGDDKALLLWEVEGAGKPAVLEHDAPITSLIFTSITHVAAGDENGLVVLCDLSDQSTALLKKMDKGPVRSLAFASQTRELAVGYQNAQVTIWDLPSQTDLRPYLQSQMGQIVAVAITPDGKKVAVAGARGARLFVWERTANRATMMGTVESEQGAEFRTASFSPEGKTLATLGRDGTIRLWNPTTQKELPASRR